MSLPETLNSNHNITHGGLLKQEKDTGTTFCVWRKIQGKLHQPERCCFSQPKSKWVLQTGSLAGFRTGSLPKSPLFLSLFAQMCSAGQGYKPGDVVSGPFCPLQADRGRLSCSSHPYSAGTNGDSHFLSPFGSVFNNILLVHFVFCLPWKRMSKNYGTLSYFFLVK